MRRTQLYLDDHLWKALHAHAHRRHTTISELVREAIRERYFGESEERRKAMQAVIGIRQDRSGAPDASTEIRQLRKGSRLDRLYKT